MELMDAVDNYIPIPQRENEKPFLMPVEDVFSITGRGTVVTGRIETGVIHVGDPVEIIGLEEKTHFDFNGREMFRKLLDEGEAGDNVGLLPAVSTRKRLSAVWLSLNRVLSPAHQVPG